MTVRVIGQRWVGAGGKPNARFPQDDGRGYALVVDVDEDSTVVACTQAINELEQPQQTLDARRRWELEQRRAWGRAATQISARSRRSLRPRSHRRSCSLTLERSSAQRIALIGVSGRGRRFDCRPGAEERGKQVRGRQLYITMGALLVSAAILFPISGIPRFKNGHGLDGIIGGIGWFGGLLCVLGLLVLGGIAIVRAIRGRRDPVGV